MSNLRDDLQKHQEEHSVQKPQGLYVADRFSDFWHQQSVWSQNTFGLDSERGPLGPLEHLKKEVKEALDAYHMLETCIAENPDVHITEMQRELIDCQFLIVDALRRSGVNYETFLDMLEDKLKINKSRSWPRSAGDNERPIEHDRTLDNKSAEGESWQKKDPE